MIGSPLSRSLFAALLVGLGSVTACAIDVVQFTVRVTHDGAPVAARVLVRDSAGGAHVPPVATTVNIGSDTWFLCDGSARLDVPAGEYRIEVERGPEFAPARGTVSLRANSSRDFPLHRWIDMETRGYRSGENHLHLPPRLVPLHLAAEDLDFGSSLAWWNGPRFSPPPELHAAENLTLFDAEVENAWGAIYCIGLREPMPVEWNARRANLAYARAARRSGGLIAYQGGWSREVLVDALLGLVDVVNVGDNLFHRHKFMPRSRNSNLLGVPGLPVYPETAEGMLSLATESYYRLLNCGLRLAAGAGSATGVKSNPAGYNCAYVRVAENATVSDFLEAWRAGRNFVTNGPMVFLTAEDREPGDTIALPAAGGKVRVRAEAKWPYPLRELALIVNGRRVAHPRDGKLDTEIELREGAWVAALAIADDDTSDHDLARFRERNRNGGEEPTRLRFAHTSPIYVTVGGRGARVEASIAEARAMLDAFETFARNTAAPEFCAEILEAVATARTKL